MQCGGRLWDLALDAILGCLRVGRCRTSAPHLFRIPSPTINWESYCNYVHPVMTSGFFCFGTRMSRFMADIDHNVTFL
jgi:hypothetical protein